MKTAITFAVAGAALIALPALAQTTDKTTTSPSTTTTSAQTEKKPAMYEMKPGQWRATKLKGVDVYNAGNDKIGSISELIVDREGKIEAVVIGVGGFLGMGEHDVAVPFNQVKWVDEPVNKTATTTTTTTPGSGTSTGTSTAPATSTPPSTAGGTRTTTTADRTAGTTTTTTSRDHTYPDHAVVNMTKDQLKALPEVKYDRS